MRTRKLHSKSRQGCLTCKKRRVKCDEKGPPCGGCVLKNTSCSYASTESRDGAIAESEGTSIGSSSASSRQLELELMHRWTSSTYRSLRSAPQDDYLLQIVAPHDALRHGFLMHGLLALAAMDLALNVDANRMSSPEAYVDAAARYYDQALTEYLSNLEKITPDNHLALFIFSSVLPVLHFSISQSRPREDPGRETTLEAVYTVFNLLYGSSSLAVSNSDLIEKSPIPVKDLKDALDAPVYILDRSTARAFARLYMLNDKANGDPVQANHGWYRTAISHLENFFNKRVSNPAIAFWISWPGMVDREFAPAVQKSEPLALVVVMYWAVLLDDFSNKREDAWWAKGVGRELIREICEVMRPWTVALMPEWTEAISWAREQVNLVS